MEINKTHKINYNGNYVILADIHGNYEALEAAVITALSTYGNGKLGNSRNNNIINGFIFLGDYEGDFPHSNKVFKLMNALKDNYGYEVYSISGNRETKMLEKFRQKTKGHYDNNGKIDIEKAEELLGWSLNSSMGAPLIDFCKINENEIEAFTKLPEVLFLENDKQIIAMKHQMPLNKEELAFLKSKEEKQKIVLSAHTHEPNYGEFGDIYFFNPGSVGLTDTGKKGADFAILNHGKLVPIHIDYDYEKTINELRQERNLYDRCENWGTLLELSIRYGINVNALYAYEKVRIKRALKSLQQDDINRFIGLSEYDAKELIKELVPALKPEEKPFATCLTTNFNPLGGYVNTTTFIGNEIDATLTKSIDDIENHIVTKGPHNIPTSTNAPKLPSEAKNQISSIAHEYIETYCSYIDKYGAYIKSTRAKK